MLQCHFKTLRTATKATSLKWQLINFPVLLTSSFFQPRKANGSSGGSAAAGSLAARAGTQAPGLFGRSPGRAVSRLTRPFGKGNRKKELKEVTSGLSSQQLTLRWWSRGIRRPPRAAAGIFSHPQPDVTPADRQSTRCWHCPGCCCLNQFPRD